jgi:cold shock CspA family protein/thioredoxin-like negative regulator of GroEL
MDVDYEADREAFDQLIRGRTLAELFADHVLAYRIFDAALQSGANRWYVLHQRAVFELNHFKGSLKRALEHTREAEIAAGRPERVVLHTRAMILRRLASDAEVLAERSRYRGEARAILERQLDSARESHAHHTYAQLLIDELEEKNAELAGLTDEDEIAIVQRAVAELVRDVEKVLYIALQRFPGDEHLLTMEARFAKVLENDPRIERALTKAFNASPGRGFVAVRLARHQAAKGDMDSARATLLQCLQQNPVSKEAHLELARVLMKLGELGNAGEIAYHLKRSFTKGDANYGARFWYARHEYLYGDGMEAEREFHALAESKLPPGVINRADGLVKNTDGSVRDYSGSLRALYTDYGFVSSVGLPSDVFAHLLEFPPGIWEQVFVGMPVKFNLSFRMRGPYAINIRPAVE